MSKFRETNKKIEKAVVSGYKEIEETVVGGYKKIENSVVSGYKKIEGKFVDAFLTPDDGEEENEGYLEKREETAKETGDERHS